MKNCMIEHIANFILMKKGKLSRFIMFAVMVVLLQANGLCVLDVSASARVGTVTADQLNVRTGAGTTYKILQSAGANVKIIKGTKVTITKEKNDWFYITFSYNKKTLKGYVLSEYINESKTGASTSSSTSKPPVTSSAGLSIKGTVNSAKVNVRKTASRTGAKLLSGKNPVVLSKKLKVTVLGESIVNGEKWYQVSFKMNSKTQKGYVLSDYIQLTLSESVKASVNSKSAVKIRTGAGEKKAYLLVNKKTVSLKNKTAVTITKEVTVSNGKWFKVSFTYNGAKKTGYIAGNSLLYTANKKEPVDTGNSNGGTEEDGSPVDDKMTGTVINTNALRVRTGAGTSHSQLETADKEKVYLNQDQKVVILKETTDGKTVWYQIQFEYGKKTYKGYVSGVYIKLTTGADADDGTSDIDDNGEEEEDDDKGEDMEQETPILSDTEFEAMLDTEGFPESYKPYLRELHQQNPAWGFEAYHTNLDWGTVIANQTKVGKNLITNTKNIAWKSLETGAYNWKTDKFIAYDGSTWVTASKQAVEYYMDPRNFLNKSGIFQFESLKYKNSYQNAAGVERILKNTLLSNLKYSYMDMVSNESVSYTYGETFIKAAEYSNVSPYHLASRVKQEVVTGSNSLSASVTGTVAGYEGYYNFYNIGATHSTAAGGAVANALKYAKAGTTNAALNQQYMIPWDNPYHAIVGGSWFIGSSYINKGQDTVYLQKFNVTPVSTHSHQYMANVEAAGSEAVKTSAAYSQMEDVPIVFTIPVYSNMPNSVCSPPANGLNPNNWLSSLTVKDFALTPTFLPEDPAGTIYNLIVPAQTEGVTIQAAAVSAKAKVSGTGYAALAKGVNLIPITVTAENGELREYQLNIIRE